MKVSKPGLELIFAIVLLAGVFSCEDKGQRKLDIMGRKEFKEVNGKIDTIYHTIPEFQFVDQDSATITGDSFKDKIYVADFFFGSCPTICPVMKQQMLRVYQEFKNRPDFAILSHTIDPEHDTVAYLKNYAERIGVMDNSTWHFVTGDRDEIYEIGSAGGYMVPVGADEDAPGGFIHSGAFILVDREKRIRGFYDGTIPMEVTALIKDISTLLAEYE